MKKIILFIFVAVLLNGCAEYTSFLGPSITVAKTGNVTRAGSTLAASYGLEHGTGLSTRSLVEESAELREYNYKIYITIYSTIFIKFLW